MAVRLASRKSRIPFGPFMIVGAYIAVLVGTQISDLYVNTLPN
jgi:leader peptidase (prepilin peptidase)/N-methyltransferase